MGTRSLTLVHDSDDRVLVNMYRQYDGYPSGHGEDLFAFLAELTVVNGFGMGDNTGLANGMGCLAAQLVDKFKVAIGGIYLEPTDNRNCYQDYTYEIRPIENGFNLTVYGYENNELFNGTLAEFKAFCDSDK